MQPRNRTRSGQIHPVLAVAVGIVAIAGIAAAIAAARPAASADRPLVTPTAAAPTTTPPSVPSTAPSATPSSGPISIDLRNATDHDVRLQIHGDLATLDGAVSGSPSDGMSVGWHRALVTNVDARTIRVTWIGLPQDETVDLDIVSGAGGDRLTIVQAGPVPNSDAMGEDRTVVLTFDRPVSAHDVSVEILDRTTD